MTCLLCTLAAIGTFAVARWAADVGVGLAAELSRDREHDAYRRGVNRGFEEGLRAGRGEQAKGE